MPMFFVDLKQGQYDFKKVKVLVEGNAINLTGAVKKEKSHTFFDLLATTDDADLGSVIALLPEKQLKLLGDFSSSGKFHFSMDILGRLSAHESPSVESTLIMEGGQLTHPMLKEPLKEVSFEAGFTNGEGNSLQTSFFEIKDFKGYLHRELLTMHLKIEDLDDPFIDFQADGALPVGYLYDFFDHPGISGGDGEIEINNLDISGLYRDMVSTNHIFEVAMSGEIEFDDAALKINGEKMTADKGKLIFKDNFISLEELEIEGAGNDIRFDGKIENLLPVLFADSINSKDANLIFSGEMYAVEMDLAKLRKMADVPFDEGTFGEEIFDSLNVKKYERREQITDFLQGNFSARVDQFIYNKIKGSKLSGTACIQ